MQFSNKLNFLMNIMPNIRTESLVSPNMEQTQIRNISLLLLKKATIRKPIRQYTMSTCYK